MALAIKDRGNWESRRSSATSGHNPIQNPPAHGKRSTTWADWDEELLALALQKKDGQNAATMPLKLCRELRQQG